MSLPTAMLSPSPFLFPRVPLRAGSLRAILGSRSLLLAGNSAKQNCKTVALESGPLTTNVRRCLNP